MPFCNLFVTLGKLFTHATVTKTNDNLCQVESNGSLLVGL